MQFLLLDRCSEIQDTYTISSLKFEGVRVERFTGDIVSDNLGTAKTTRPTNPANLPHAKVRSVLLLPDEQSLIK